MEKLSFQPGDLLISVEGHYSLGEGGLAYVGAGSFAVFEGPGKTFKTRILGKRIIVRELSALEALAFIATGTLSETTGATRDVREADWELHTWAG